jgi:signal transduction histidine kinase
MPSDSFPRLVSLACHDLRTPLATVYGFARTLSRSGELDERSARFVAMIAEASDQLAHMLDDLGVAARIQGGRWEPALREADTLELAGSQDERIGARGAGETIETEPESVARGLEALALAAIRHGPVAAVTWEVRGRELALAPVHGEAATVVAGEGEPRDLGSAVARLVIERLGGSLALEGETLRVRL